MHCAPIGGAHGDTVYDVVVVGGGIVGLATARETALRYPHMKIALLEKEPRLGTYVVCSLCQKQLNVPLHFASVLLM